MNDRHSHGLTLVMAVLAVFATTTILATAGCVPLGDDGSATEVISSPIVGGTTETKWPAVGALTMSMSGYYMGAFCSATLISSEWVLTAGHCLSASEDFTPTTSNTEFFIGNSANPINGHQKPSGTFVKPDLFVVHPNYNPDDYDLNNDIALMHLSTPVTGVTPIALNTTYLTNSVVGTSAFYVGFGVNDGEAGTGGGVKRSASIPIHALDSSVYYSEGDQSSYGPAVCFGDSGGPGLLQVSGTWKVIGVNSAVSGTGSDPCIGTGIHTRVDYYSSWISNKTNSELPDCNDDPSICMCAEACESDGSCDNTVCHVYDCKASYNCLVNCGTDSDCQNDCYSMTTEEGQIQLNDMLDCLDENCKSASSDEEYQECAYESCGDEINTCFPSTSGELTCEESYECMYDCGQDQNCAYDCYNQGTSIAQQQMNAMFQCWEDNCSSITGDAWQECALTQCGEEIDACLPPANCDITGGDCPSGTACYRTPTGATDCYTSDEIGVGNECDSTVTDRLSCEDGAVCLSFEDADQCMQFCVNDNDCEDGEMCYTPIFTGIEDIGWCDCIDGDEDGICQADDCNDDDASVYPYATEACGNSVDDDCDGQTDENCENCTDDDNDDYCVPDDCDDSNASVHPGGVEYCNNSVDDDCDGQTDEDCEGCVDGDRDGVCLTADCNDSNAEIHPGGVEYCNNSVDDDCDGQTDEDCEGCVDGDRDGVCLTADCNDSNAEIHPGATEVCNNSVDDDCDGQTDEDCSSVCTDADLDGVCVPNDCDDSNASVKPGATEQCANGIDDNCDGRTDEDCGICLDSDVDGVCVPFDCNDNDNSVSPTILEACGDNKDNNCNGVVDEGCSACVDADDDGSCQGEDCNDQDETVYPGAAEVCGDGKDNDCNGAIDDLCTGSSDGGCSAGSTPSGAGIWWIVGLLLLGFAFKRSLSTSRVLRG